MENHDIHALETIESLDNYNSYVFNKIFNIGLKNNVLDFGCGFGTFIEYINKNYKLDIFFKSFLGKNILVVSKKKV